MTARTAKVIDVHSHIYPRWYIEMLKERTEAPRVSGEEGDERFVIFPDEEAASSHGGRAMTDDYWSIETKLAFMERHGIDQTLLSLGNPWFEPFSADVSAAAARRLNSEFATLGSRTADRILGMGVLPGKGVSEVVAVIEEIATTDGLFGVVSGMHIAGLALDDDGLDPVWALLEHAEVPLLLHPHHGSAMDELAGYGHVLPVSVGFPVETTVALARLVFSGVPHRYPRLRLVASHGGGTIPYLAGRLDAGWASDTTLVGRLPVPPSTVLERLFLDAVLYHPRALRAAAELVGVDHLVFGTDHPFSIADPEANLAAIRDAFDATDASTLLSGVAIDLYGIEDGD